jgi:hypothetical protein
MRLSLFRHSLPFLKQNLLAMKKLGSGTTNSETHTPTRSPTSSRENADEELPQTLTRLVTANSVRTSTGSKLKKEISKTSLSKSERLPLPSYARKSTFKSPSQTRRLIAINITTMTGKILTIEIMPTETVGQLKEKIAFEEGIAADVQMLVYCGNHLKDNLAVLKQLGIQDGSNLQLVVEMAGGNGFVI